MPRFHVSRARSRWRLVVLAGVLGTAFASGAVWTNAFGAGDRFEGLAARIELALDPPPDRPTRPTVTVTPRPVLATPTHAPDSESPGPAVGPSAPPVEPTRSPVRQPVDVDILPSAEAMFSSQVTKDWCAPAGVQMVLAILGLADTSDDFQRELAGRIDEWESYRDSHNGGWGPAAMVEAFDAYGARGYEIRAYGSRGEALRDAAVALEETSAPVVLIAWRGAHTWVMTGFRADADPTAFSDGTISGAYILDPWYPRVSSIWGPSDPPGTFQDAAEMKRNFLPWKRPEGRYGDRDGKFIVLIPTIAVRSAG